MLFSKKLNYEKDAQIKKLQFENVRKDLHLKKIFEEISELKKSDSLFKKIIQDKNTTRKKNFKKLEITKMISESSSQISEENSDNLIEYFSQKVKENLTLANKIDNEEKELKEMEQEYDNSQNYAAELLIKKEKFDDKKDNKVELEEENEEESFRRYFDKFFYIFYQ